MGEMAEMFEGLYDFQDDYPCPEEYLHMTDDELRAATAMARNTKIKGICAWSGRLSAKQRFCLAAWIANNELIHV